MGCRGGQAVCECLEGHDPAIAVEGRPVSSCPPPCGDGHEEGCVRIDPEAGMDQATLRPPQCPAADSGARDAARESGSGTTPDASVIDAARESGSGTKPDASVIDAARESGSGMPDASGIDASRESASVTIDAFVVEAAQ